jgi:hypothetical protein
MLCNDRRACPKAFDVDRVDTVDASAELVRSGKQGELWWPRCPMYPVKQALQVSGTVLQGCRFNKEQLGDNVHST